MLYSGDFYGEDEIENTPPDHSPPRSIRKNIKKSIQLTKSPKVSSSSSRELKSFGRSPLKEGRETWECIHCTMINQVGWNKCQICGKDVADSLAAASPMNNDSGVWHCTYCTLENAADSDVCAACDNKKVVITQMTRSRSSQNSQSSPEASPKKVKGKSKKVNKTTIKENKVSMKWVIDEDDEDPTLNGFIVPDGASEDENKDWDAIESDEDDFESSPQLPPKRTSKNSGNSVKETTSQKPIQRKNVSPVVDLVDYDDDTDDDFEKPSPKRYGSTSQKYTSEFSPKKPIMELQQHKSQLNHQNDMSLLDDHTYGGARAGGPNSSSSVQSHSRRSNFELNANRALHDVGYNDVDIVSDSDSDDPFESAAAATAKSRREVTPGPSLPELSDTFWTVSDLQNKSYCSINFNDYRLDSVSSIATDKFSAMRREKNEAKAEKETKKRAEKAKGRAAGGKKSASTGKASWARRKFGKKK